MSDSNVLKICRFNSSIPLNTDSTMTNAIVPTPTPSMDRIDSQLMKLRFFFEKKYRRAIQVGRFILV